jgi:CheY-like chemotaxis protein
MADRPPRILLVDDEQPIQTLLSFPLQRDGYEVVQASDGREALTRFSEQPFDLVVLDVMMPRMDGWSVLEAVGKLPEESRPHVVMVTALASAPDRERAERLGAVAYVTKPFDMDQLVQVLHGCLALAS